MKHFFLGLLIAFFSGIFSETLAVEYQNFPESACESVNVIYLESKEKNSQEFLEYRLFEVNKNQNDKWELDPDEGTRAEKEGFKTEQDIKDRQVLQRFKFGTGNYKKYCVGFQESVPVGSQGENANSIGADSGVDLVKQYVSMIYKFGSMFIGLVCVLVIVISGVQMTTGGIDPNAYENAKNRILAALASLILLFGSAMILRTVNPGFFT